MYRKHTELIILGLVLAAVFFLMGLLNGSYFFQVDNFRSMAFQLPELGILSLAMMITMLTGGINLSIIASANLTGIVVAMILTRLVTPTTPDSVSFLVVLMAIVVGLSISALIGLLNGLLIARVEVSPILATLGTMILLNGLSIVLTRGYVISGFPPALLFIGNGMVFGVPMPMIIFLLCAGIMALILNHTPLGVSIYMIGSNPIACLFSGVNNRQVLMRTYLISGLYTGVAALIMIARFNSAKSDYGASYLLMTVLASVLGGTSAAGGFGKVSGLVMALAILQVVSSGLNLLGISAFMTIALWGAILILVMVIGHFSLRWQERRHSGG